MNKQTKEFLEILMLTQEELYNYIIDFLRVRNIKYKAKDEAYIYINDHAWNVTRPLLTSHLDTINDSYNELPRLSIKDNISLFFALSINDTRLIILRLISLYAFIII